MKRFKFFTFFKKYIVSSLFIFSFFSFFFIQSCPYSNNVVSAAEVPEELTVTQAWDYTPGASWYQYDWQDTVYPVEPLYTERVNFPAPTTADSIFGYGNYHFRGPYKRLTSVKFHVQAVDPFFKEYGYTQYQYKYNCEMHFFMGGYKFTGTQISCYLDVGVHTGQSGVTEHLTFDSYNIFDLTSSSQGFKYLSDEGKFVINFAELFNSYKDLEGNEVNYLFGGSKYVDYVDVHFIWSGASSTNSYAFTAFIPQTSYVPYSSSGILPTPNYPHYSTPPIVGDTEDLINGYINDNYNNVFGTLDELNLFKIDSIMARIGNSTEFITHFISGITDNPNSPLSDVFFLSVIIGIAGFILFGMSIFSKIRR